ncbi:MAG: hypothetical protein WCD18_07545 [Thermosynechococcaceae cyanobacterium]
MNSETILPQDDEIVIPDKSLKLYRDATLGPTVPNPAFAITKIKLVTLTCFVTEDVAGSDEYELRIWWDNNYTSRRKDMDNGDVWGLNIRLDFQYRVKIELWDRDNPPIDGNDKLGTVIINPGKSSGRGFFGGDGAQYSIIWGAA